MIMESVREFMDDIKKILYENSEDYENDPFEPLESESSSEKTVDSIISGLISKLQESGDEEKAKKVLELSEKFVLELKEIVEATEAETVDYNADIHSDEFDYPRS